MLSVAFEIFNVVLAEFLYSSNIILVAQQSVNTLQYIS